MQQRKQNGFLSHYFPDEVMENILVRLPVKSIISFKVVSKWWMDFLSCPDFVKLQVHHAKAKQMLLLYSLDSVSTEPEISIAGKRRNLFEINRVFTPFQLVKDIDGGGVIEDSCNGLVSLRFRSFDSSIPTVVYLWNPATRESKCVEQPYIQIDSCVGLTFISETNDYKMVRVPCSSEKKSSVWVYSLNFNSWKTSNISLQYGRLSPSPAILIHGCMHWLTEIGEHIASFNVESEVFKYLPLMSDKNGMPRGRQLGVIKGSLSLVMFFSNSKHDLVYEVWQMRTYGIANSWCKVAFIKEFNGIIPNPVGVFNDGILFRHYWMNQELVLFYDPFTEDKHYLPLWGRINPEIVNYVETLESLSFEKNICLHHRHRMACTGVKISEADSTSHGQDSGNVASSSRISDGKGKADESDLKLKGLANQKHD